MSRLTADQLTGTAAGLLAALGVPAEHAALTARRLVDADLDGVSSHGLARLPNYLELLQSGAVHARPVCELVPLRTTTAALNADHALGQVAVEAALQWAIPTARQHGSAVVTIRSANHIGALASYLRSLTDAHLIGLLMSNSPPAVAPHGAASPLFGSNPLGIGVPLTGRPPFILDMATAAAARGTLLTAQRDGTSLPPGLALSADGLPTTDPTAALAGALLPFGGAKGSGLAFAVELLTGVLAGAALSAEQPSFFAAPTSPVNVGILLIVLDPAAFLPAPLFDAAAERLIASFAATPPLDPQQPLRYPGERAAAARADQLQHGLTIAPATIAALRRWTARLGLPDRFTSARVAAHFRQSEIDESSHRTFRADLA